MRRRIIMVGLVLGLGDLGACDLEREDDEREGFRVGYGGTLAYAEPGTGGTWLGNGLQKPDVSGLDPSHGLNAGNGLKADGGLLSTPEGRDVARYLVECALPLGDSISKKVGEEKLTFHGFLGLAPQWKDEGCDQSCQEWVSACLLARTNASGQSVDLWVSAAHPSIGLGPSDDYPHYEATFYGNLFADPPTMFFCRGTEEGEVAAMANGRTCTGQTPEDCGFTTLGSCFEPDRCELVDGTYAVECADGDPATGARHHSLSTYVSAPEQ
ncbi:hypothetical protein [Paraliomyxa miuraensis]|uniref:hypothetical protein n=1 Tax=Paraliomyxa miuraensis TaxID=376150 RepID=UPI0022531DE7|nr:hypothetical protein [Paraliomyxa miuraensis]MCX4245374.1 hypothetical protein [Paraliomyxa miuraensis]